MNKFIKTAIGRNAAKPHLPHKLMLTPIVLGIVALTSAPITRAADECGAGPVVECAGHYATGITYDFNTDFTISLTSPNVGTAGLRLTGTGDADLRLTTFGGNMSGVYGEGGAWVTLDSGNLIADIAADIKDGTFGAPGGGGFRVSTGGSADILLRGHTNQYNPNYKIGDLVLDVGADSSVTLEYRRTVQMMTLSPRAGATLTVRNIGGILGRDDLNQSVTDGAYIRGAGAGNLVIDNTGPRGRIASAMDFTGMTGELTILNDHSGGPWMGGWQTSGTSLFGSGEVEVQNRRYGVLRTAGTAVFDFSGNSESRFYNEGRLMVGTAGIDGDPHVTFVGLDRFENAGLILLGTEFSTDFHQGLVTNGRVGDRLTFQDSTYVGVEGGRIAMDVALAGVTQADCSTGAVADCVRFTGSTTTSGVTLLDVTDVTPLRSAARFNAGITLIEGASAAEHFVLDPASQFYVGHTSQGPALQKGMVAYSLRYDAGTKQHRLVGALADEAAQASTLGTAAHEAWRLTADTWFDRQAAERDESRGTFNPHALWFTVNTSKGDRSLSRTVDVAGTPTTYNLEQDQSISHLAFGLDLLRGNNGRQSWNGGVTVGVLHSAVDYDATQTQTKMTGMAVGVYGSFALAAGLSIDGMYNSNYMRQELDGSHFALGQYNRIRTQVESSGARLEAAWKFAVGEGFWLQPLLGVSNVRTSEGDIKLPDGAGGVEFGNDDRSVRIGGGVRVGMDARVAGLRTEYRLTGRMWNDRDAQNSVLVHVGGEPQPVALTDDFGGNFNELDGSVSVATDSGALSGYLGVKHKFGDDYSSIGGSLGVRYQW